MNIISIIEKKRYGKELSKEEIKFFIENYVLKKNIADYQASAFLMAIAINGLTYNETFWLTDEMIKSSKIFKFKNFINGHIIDKHSTGGVGDKVSLILAPICSALGINVAKLSGKGLGFTGGTIDKLSSININTLLNERDGKRILKSTGILIMQQQNNVVPADKLLYSLRNSSGSVDSIPLIASSIVSKKIILDSEYIFLDIKVGDGGFCTTLPKAIKLAKLMIFLFKKFRRRAIIFITGMDQPLGKCIGNALEIKAVINFLLGKPESKEIENLIMIFMTDILLTLKVVKNKINAEMLIKKVIKNRLAYDAFCRWAIAQGSNKKFLLDGCFKPKHKANIYSNRNCYISYKSTREIGNISFLLGAGRIKVDDQIDYNAGIYLNKIHNDFVKKGDLIATLYSSKSIEKNLIDRFKKNIIFQNKKFKTPKLIFKIFR